MPLKNDGFALKKADDFEIQRTTSDGGNRMLTMLIYLRVAERGGATEFPVRMLVQKSAATFDVLEDV